MDPSLREGITLMDFIFSIRATIPPAANANMPMVLTSPARIVVRRFFPCGPCLTEGELVRRTARFVVFTEWKGGDDYTGREKRLACDSVHTEPCPRCTDHPRTSYRHGHMD